MSNLRLAPVTGALPRVADAWTRTLPSNDPATPKGSNTWDWPYPSEIVSGRTVVARRFRDDQVGNHFHPRVANKDPEKFLLIMGKVQFWFEDLFGGVRQINLDADASGPIEIVAPPYVLHGMVILSVTACFLEQQPDIFSPATTHFSADEFRLLRASQNIKK